VLCAGAWVAQIGIWVPNYYIGLNYLCTEADTGANLTHRVLCGNNRPVNAHQGIFLTAYQRQQHFWHDCVRSINHLYFTQPLTAIVVALLAIVSVA
jgi:hypothetical protein